MLIAVALIFMAIGKGILIYLGIAIADFMEMIQVRILRRDS